MEGFLLEFKEMKDSIHTFKGEIQTLQDVNSKHCDEIAQMKEENSQMKEENSQMKEENSQMKEENSQMKEENSQMKEENSQMKKENSTLQEQIDALQRKETEEKAGENTKPSLVSPDDSVAMFNKKVDRLSNKVCRMEKTMKDIKEEFTTGMTTIQETSTKMEERNNTLVQLQRVFNTLHMSLQTRKDLEEEVKDLKTEITTMTKMNQPGETLNVSSNTPGGNLATPVLQVPVPLLSSGGKHPSKRAVSSNEAREQYRIRQETIKRSTFRVDLDRITTGMTVWIGGYTKVTRPCDFMDPESGVYSVPTEGEYEFKVFRNNMNDGGQIYLCRDRDDKHERISYGINDYQVCTSICWQCELNDKVWLETVGPKRDNVISQLSFYGNMM